jgi:hypothetical protein
MARKRTIDPDLWTDAKVTQLSVPARLLYIGLISIADDEGRFEWNAVQIRNRVLPDGASAADIGAWLAEIEAQELVGVYAVDGKSYGYHPAWHRHQSTSKPNESKFPDPPGTSRRYVRNGRDVIDMRKNAKSLSSNSGSTPGVVQEYSGSPPGDSGSIPGALQEHSGSPPCISDSDSDTDSDTPKPPRGPGAESQRIPRPLTEPFGFADWFFAESFALGLIGFHEPDRRDAWVTRELRAASTLLQNGVDECQTRGRRYLLALKSGELTKSAPTVRGLLASWDFGCVRTETKKRPFAVVPAIGTIRAEDRDGGWKARREAAAATTGGDT